MNENFDLEKQMFNSSSISDYMGCPMLWHLTWMRRLRKKEVSPALRFGSVWHEVMKEWYGSGDVEKAEKLFDQLPSGIGGDHRTKEWGIAIFKQYRKRYATETGKTLHLEVKFRVEIGSRLYAGTMDRIENWGGQIYVDDHKTTKSLGLSFFESFRPHPQIDGYCFACRETVGSCNGAMINGVSTAKAPKERFQRFPSSRTDEEIDGWKEVFTDETDSMLRDIERNHFPRKTVYCNRWGKCKYWELCVYYRTDEEMREKFIAANFEVEEIKSGDGAAK